MFQVCPVCGEFYFITSIRNPRIGWYEPVVFSVKGYVNPTIFVEECSEELKKELKEEIENAIRENIENIKGPYREIRCYNCLKRVKINGI